MFDSAIAKTHEILHRSATWTVENPKNFMALAAAKCAAFTAAMAAFMAWKDHSNSNGQSGDSIQLSQHTSWAKRILIDVGVSLITGTATYLASRMYVDHPNWHPKDKKSADKGPEGAEAASEKGAKPPVVRGRRASAVLEQAAVERVQSPSRSSASRFHVPA